ncbi:hypothetical protein N7470_009935 [Penicillium chermesinum]|nr:hypothetical protein N7470_009935 [Penicillium chermesinum]
MEPEGHISFGNQGSNSGFQIGKNTGNIHIQSGPAQDSACLRDLRITDSVDDKARIEEFKGDSLEMHTAGF